jgi:hypothetical protein
MGGTSYTFRSGCHQSRRGVSSSAMPAAQEGEEEAMDSMRNRAGGGHRGGRRGGVTGAAAEALLLFLTLDGPAWSGSGRRGLV